MHTLPIGHIKRKTAQVVPSVSRKGNILRHRLSIVRLYRHGIALIIRHALSVYSMTRGIHYPLPPLHSHTPRAEAKSQKVKPMSIGGGRSKFNLYISHTHPFLASLKVNPFCAKLIAEIKSFQFLKK